MRWSCERRGRFRPKRSSARLRDEGARRYHDQHPFHRACTPGGSRARSSRAWVRTAATTRRASPSRTRSSSPRARIRASAACGSTASSTTTAPPTAKAGSRSGCASAEGVGSTGRGGEPRRASCPAVRFACDAYVHAGARGALRRGGGLVADRVLRARHHVAAHRRLGAALPVDRRRARSTTSARACRARAPTADEAIEFVVAEARTAPSCRSAACAALVKKPEILWRMLDGVPRRTRSSCAMSARAEDGPGSRLGLASTGSAGLDARLPAARCARTTASAAAGCSLAPERGFVLNGSALAVVRSVSPAAARSPRLPRAWTVPHDAAAVRAARSPRAGSWSAAPWRGSAGEPASRRRPYTLIAELTYRCPLRCPYCSNPTRVRRRRRADSPRATGAASSPRPRRSA